MVEELYSIYLPKKTHPWCYISLEINPNNVDVNVHPTKHEVRFLHEEAIIEQMKIILDEKLSGNNASRTFYLQARMPQVNITKSTLQEVLPEYDKDNVEKTKKIHPREMIRTSSSDQKLDKFNFTVQTHPANDPQEIPRDLSPDEEFTLSVNPLDFDAEFQNDNCEITVECGVGKKSGKDNIVDVTKTLDEENIEKNEDERLPENSSQALTAEGNIEKSKNPFTVMEESLGKSSEKKNHSAHILLPKETPKSTEKSKNHDKSHWSNLVDEATSIDSFEMDLKASDQIVTSTQPEDSAEKTISKSIFDPPSTEDDSSSDAPGASVPISKAADRALKTVYKYYGTQENVETASKQNVNSEKSPTKPGADETKAKAVSESDKICSSEESKTPPASKEFKSYSVNKFRIQVKLHSILTLRKEIEDNYHEGLRDIISSMIFVGSVDEKSALIQSGVNLYICDTIKLA